MAKKKKAPEEKPKHGSGELTRVWRKRFTKAAKYQKDNSSSWETNQRLLYGCIGENPSPYDIALGWGMSQLLISQIYYSNPTVIVRGRSNEARDIARLLSDICQYDAEEMDVRDCGNLALVDNFTHGYGAVIEDYCNEISDYDNDGEPGKEISEQYYMARRIPPEDILFDPDGIKLDLSDHKYIFVAYYPTLTCLHEDKERYKWLPDDIDESKSAKPSKPAKDAEMPIGAAKDDGDKDPDYKQIRVYEIWDKVSEKVYDFAADKKKVIGERDWPFKLCRTGKELFPVTLLGLLQQGPSFYPKPFLDLISPQLKAITKVNKMFITDATTKWRKYLAVSGVIDTDKAAKVLDTSNDGVGIIPVDKDELEDMVTPNIHQHADLHNLFVPVEDIKINQDYLVAFETLMQQIQQIIGFSDPSRGGLPKTRSSREAVAIKEAQGKRIAKMADPIITFHKQFIEKHIMILQQTADVERYVKVVDELGRFKLFQNYTKDDVQGTFFFDALVGSSRPRDTESAKAEMINFSQMFMPFLQKEGYSIAPIVYQLAELFQIKNVDDFFRNQKEAAKMAAAILMSVKEGKKVPPQAMIEATSKLIGSVLTQDELQTVGAMVSGGQPESGGGGEVVPMGSRGESDTSKAS